MNIEIANRLVNLRKTNNLSQEALAEKLGISRQAVSKWERAEASPDTDNLILLARLYGVSLDDLLRTEDEIPVPEKEAGGTDDHAYEEGADDGGENSNIHIGINGICVEKGKKQVHIDWKGIRVGTEEGQNVNVNWNGIHVNEQERDFGGWEDEEGWDGIHVVENGREVFPHESGWAAEPKLRFPTALLISIAYLVVGIVYGAWHPGWLLFLWIPIVESLITAVKRRNASRFAYPMLVAWFFLTLGFLKGNWMGWIAFLTVPVYYTLISFLKDLLRHRRWKKQQQKEEKDAL